MAEREDKIEKRVEALVKHDVHLLMSGIIAWMQEKDEEARELVQDALSDGAQQVWEPTDVGEEPERCPNCDNEHCAEGDTEYPEVYEWWAVSSWLGEQIQGAGGVVIDDFWGLVVWGRQETGQSLTMDSELRAVAKRIEEEL